MTQEEKQKKREILIPTLQSPPLQKSTLGSVIQRAPVPPRRRAVDDKFRKKDLVISKSLLSNEECRRIDYSSTCSVTEVQQLRIRKRGKKSQARHNLQRADLIEYKL